MNRLRRIMGAAFLWAMPRPMKEARIDRALREMTRSFAGVWHGRYNHSRYQVPPSQGDPLMTRP